MELTVEHFIRLVFSPGPIYFYEEEPTTLDEQGNEDFSEMEEFLVLPRVFQPSRILLPEICSRTISQIYFADGAFRVVLD